jgi:hypothetical protein
MSASTSRSSSRAVPRLMWVTPDCLFYAGLLGAPSMRTMGCVNIYIATEGQVKVQVHRGDLRSGRAVVVPPYTPHEVAAQARDICVVQIEAEAIAPDCLPPRLTAAPVHDDRDALDALAQQILASRQALESAYLSALDFDRALLGVSVAPRVLEGRIACVLRSIKTDPAASVVLLN